MNAINHNEPASPSPGPEPKHPSFKEALLVWTKVAMLSFGGPAGQIAVMHRILVQEKQWVSESRFLHALNYCMLLPGPEAQQLATYIGWLLHRTWGGLVAGTLFVLPGFISILVLSILYARFQSLAVVQALFFGLKPAVLAVVIEAVIRIGRKALKNPVTIGIAALAFIGIFFLEVPFPAIIMGAAFCGLAGKAIWPAYFNAKSPAHPAEGKALLSDKSDAAIKPALSRIIKVGGVWLVLWFLPLIILTIALGVEHVFVKEGWFFSKMAAVTFGGAYAVLAYVAQQAVDTYQWVQASEMLDGLGMAETTPGPLIQVVQFVGFMGAYRNPGSLDPVVAGVLASVLVTWVTFVPCFLWIFLGAPYIEYLRGKATLAAALSAITAAVVGVILNLAIWFALHTLFTSVEEQNWYGVRLLRPDWQTLNWDAALIAVGSFTALFWLRLGMIKTLALSVVAGGTLFLVRHFNLI